ncbi:(2Fe-2S)-binding protein [Paraburkholderia sp. BL10I2N1]|uniref:(2Fe-2S)-binding protein n=1 Tax=Paraburkholderia sp. BL10I2N1 TaxID=1938796 RepID=UPI0010EC3A44|nr:(2Fe-2S)-binding protein [Paraburkholderia sp. BL10I2N1]TDN62417.1 carbon-monoxide dehydrogenase small subunit [Paraburkholderia sp. BL10I2N1]
MTDNVEEMFEDSVSLSCRLNGKLCEELIPPETSLLTFVREMQGLKGTHMGCMTGHCGACTVLIDGKVAKSCITLAATALRTSITTIEGLAHQDGTLSEIQTAFRDASAFQCGFCAPGMVLTAVELLSSNLDPSEEEIRESLSGNLCRCTGYRSIVAGIQLAAERIRSRRGDRAELSTAQNGKAAPKGED